MDLKCTLIDYEKITDEYGWRLIFFGNYAGYAGMIDTLGALGRRWEWEGEANPFEAVNHTYTYGNLEEAIEAKVVEKDQLGLEYDFDRRVFDLADCDDGLPSIDYVSDLAEKARTRAAR